VPDATERLVNLALFLASSRAYVSADACRAAGLGYPDGQDEAAFLRMFERDKDALRAAGLVIDVRKAEEVEAYRLDAEATFARDVALEPAEVAAIRAIAAALVGDPGFPFSDDLAFALAKLGAAGDAGSLATGELAQAADAAHAPEAAALAEAVQRRKVATFGYTNQYGETKHHTVEPFGLFFRDGRWYLVGLDRDRGEIRTYAVGRMDRLAIEKARPHTADFEPPGDFRIAEYERLPFQYGPDVLTAELRFSPDVAWRAARLARGKGALAEAPDGSVIWTVEVRSLRRLAQWLVDEGPGITAMAPPGLVNTVRDGLETVVRLHG